MAFRIPDESLVIKLPDLVSSLRTGRLSGHQLPGLVSSFDFSYLLVEGTWRWGIESDVRHIHEEWLPAGQDELWLGDANVLFRFAQSESVQMRTGLGVNFLNDPIGTDFGFNFTYGGDWFPVQPLVVSGELDAGTLGSSHLYHLRGTIGANWNISEVYVGYDYYDVGRTQIAGLVAGVRLWY